MDPYHHVCGRPAVARWLVGGAVPYWTHEIEGDDGVRRHLVIPPAEQHLIVENLIIPYQGVLPALPVHEVRADFTHKAVFRLVLDIDSDDAEPSPVRRAAFNGRTFDFCQLFYRELRVIFKEPTLFRWVEYMCTRLDERKLSAHVSFLDVVYKPGRDVDAIVRCLEKAVAALSPPPAILGDGGWKLDVGPVSTGRLRLAGTPKRDGCRILVPRVGFQVNLETGDAVELPGVSSLPFDLGVAIGSIHVGVSNDPASGVWGLVDPQGWLSCSSLPTQGIRRRPEVALSEVPVPSDDHRNLHFEYNSPLQPLNLHDPTVFDIRFVQLTIEHARQAGASYAVLHRTLVELLGRFLLAETRGLLFFWKARSSSTGICRLSQVKVVDLKHLLANCLIYEPAFESDFETSCDLPTRVVRVTPAKRPAAPILVKQRLLLEVFMSSTHRNQVERVHCHPRSAPVLSLFNTYTGLRISRADADALEKGGELSPSLTSLVELVYNGWCGCNASVFLAVMRWMALLVQRPWVRHGVALVANGEQGAGKSILLRALCSIVGSTHARQMDSRGPFLQWNEMLEGLIFAGVEEADLTNPAFMDRLKMYVTEDELPIRQRFKDERMVPNFSSWMFATDKLVRFLHTQIPNERRLFILEVRKFMEKDELVRQLAVQLIDIEGEPSCLLRSFAWLLYAVKIPDDYEPMKVFAALPRTTLSLVQHESGMDVVHAWWASCLEAGYVVIADASQAVLRSQSLTPVNLSNSSNDFLRDLPSDSFVLNSTSTAVTSLSASERDLLTSDEQRRGDDMWVTVLTQTRLFTAFRVWAKHLDHDFKGINRSQFLLSLRQVCPSAVGLDPIRAELAGRLPYRVHLPGQEQAPVVWTDVNLVHLPPLALCIEHFECIRRGAAPAPAPRPVPQFPFRSSALPPVPMSVNGVRPPLEDADDEQVRRKFIALSRRPPEEALNLVESGCADPELWMAARQAVLLEQLCEKAALRRAWLPLPSDVRDSLMNG